MRRKPFPAAALAAAVVPVVLWAGRAARAQSGITVEQIEAFEVDGGDDPNNPTRYAAINFNGVANPAAPTTGDFVGIRFHADPLASYSMVSQTSTGLINTYSQHAGLVGQFFYGDGYSGNGSPAYGRVSDVCATSADAFLNDVVNPQVSLGVAAAPGTFAGEFNGSAGAPRVVNNSYVGDFAPDYPTADLDSQRRVDFMIARDNVVFVAAAVTGATSVNGVAQADPVVWSSYDALAVSGAQSFNAAVSPGKPHADVSIPTTEASFGTAIVSGYSAALIARATAAGQTDATRDTVVRGLVMAGTDKTTYSPTLANHLDPTNGAGQPDYDSSVGILQGGEKALATATGTTSGSTLTGTPGTTQQGWAVGTVPAAGGSAVLFTAPAAVTGLTASLNWDVTSQSNASAGTINTSTGALLFPNLKLQVVPVTLSNGKYVLGTAPSDASLTSAATGDNVQYLSSSSTLAAGTYAFLFSGDPSLPASVGFSYVLRGTFASTYAAGTSGSWDTIGNWSNGVPDAAGAVAILPGTATSTITLDGDRRVGKLTLGGGSYTVTAGTGGTLTFDDSGDSAGTAAPTLTVSAGTHSVTAPVALANGLTVNAAAATAGVMLAAVTGTGGLVKTGPGSLVLSAPTTYGDTNVSAGSLTVLSTANLSGGLTVTGGRATFAAGAARTVQTLTSLTVGTAGTVALAPSATIAGRTLLVTSAASLAGQLDIGNGDLLVHNGSLPALTAAAATGYGNGLWTGKGIASATAAADAKHLSGVGVVLNSFNGSPLFTSFDGQPATTTDVLARYTYYGDANLDGVVNAADYTRIDAGYVNHLTGWANGDFNYDGVVDGSDYTLMDNAFNQQTTALASNAVIAPAPSPAAAAVPEPSAVVAVALSAAALGRRRRRA